MGCYLPYEVLEKGLNYFVGWRRAKRSPTSKVFAVNVGLRALAQPTVLLRPTRLARTQLKSVLVHP